LRSTGSSLAHTYDPAKDTENIEILTFHKKNVKTSDSLLFSVSCACSENESPM